jgi:hypothetical protein
MRDDNLVKQNGDRVWYVPKYGHEGKGNLKINIDKSLQRRVALIQAKS